MKEKKKKQSTGRAYFDYTLLFLVLFMVAFGIVMLYSTSYHYAEVHFHDGTYYLKLQLRNVAIGLVAMIITTFIPYTFYKKLAPWIYMGSLGLCTAVIFIGQTINNSKRWLKVGPFSFQPSETAKIAVIIFLAFVISKASKQVGRLSTVLKLIGITLPLAGLVAINNLSTAIIIVLIGMIIVFVSSPRYIHFAVPIGVAVAAAGAFVMVAGYRFNRIRYWLHPELLDAGSQTIQGLYAIGAGGWFGKGLGESLQKMGSLPEAQNDMIFSVVCEELGVVGALCVILAFILLLWRFWFIATNAPDLFGSLMVVGIMGHIAVQVVLNIAVVTNSIPNTGVTLPFISYGGTAIIFLLAEMGIALSVSRGIKLQNVE